MAIVNQFSPLRVNTMETILDYLLPAAQIPLVGSFCQMKFQAVV